MENKIERGSTTLAMKAGFWYVASTFLVKALAFITTPIFARLMSNASYGEFTNYASWQATLLIITSAELYNTLGRAYYDFTEDYNKYVSSITIASFGITFSFYLFFLLGGSWLYRIVSIPKEYVHILFFTLAFMSIKSIYMTRERTLYRYKSVATISMINLIIPTSIAVLLVVLSPESLRLPARVYGYYIPSSLIGVWCAVLLLRKELSFDIKHLKYALKLAIPILLHYLTAYLLISSNVIVTKNILGATSVAIISIATSTINILTILFQSLAGAMTTWLMDNLEQKKYQKLRRDILVYVGLLSTVALGVILLAPEIVLILGGLRYKSAASLVPGFAVAVFIQGVTALFTIILTYDKNITKTAIATSIVALLSIAAKIFLLPNLGYAVLPYIDIVSFSVLFVFNYVLVCGAGYSEPINFKGFMVMIFLVTAVMALSLYLGDRAVPRYLMVLALMGLMVWIGIKKRNVFLAILKKRSK